MIDNITGKIGRNLKLKKKRTCDLQHAIESFGPSPVHS